MNSNYVAEIQSTCKHVSGDMCPGVDAALYWLWLCSVYSARKHRKRDSELYVVVTCSWSVWVNDDVRLLQRTQVPGHDEGQDDWVHGEQRLERNTHCLWWLVIRSQFIRRRFRVTRDSDIPVTETQTDTEMIDINKIHTETNIEKIFDTVTIYISVSYTHLTLPTIYSV